MNAIVIGSGPNGLAAAVAIARTGRKVTVLEAETTVGGAARSGALTLPGFVHDLGSAIHPLAAASPFFRSLPLAVHGLEWVQPEVALAHPFDDGTAAAMYPSLEQTCDELGADGPAYRRLFSPAVSNWNALAGEMLQPMLHVPRHPLLTARFGLTALQPAASLARGVFKGEKARGLFAGLAGHSFLPLEAPASAAVALMLGAAGHVVGWPFPRGGAQAIPDALAGLLRELGGTIVTGRRIQHLGELPPSDATLLDLTAWRAASVVGERVPAGYRRKLAQFPHTPAICKVDYALDGPIPWTAEPCRRAGTVHLGGTLEEIAASERDAAGGRLNPRPFVLLAQQSLFDPTRAPAGKHTAWAYCHLPHGSGVDQSAAIDAQIERFAPGFGKLILARRVSGPGALEAENANLVGGDISGGSIALWNLVARPTLSLNPYRMPGRGLYLCSSSTPPGGGVHGMCGYHAARAALARELA